MPSRNFCQKVGPAMARPTGPVPPALTMTAPRQTRRLLQTTSYENVILWQ